MAYNSLAEFVKAIEDKGNLVRITEPVSTDLEITEITDRISKTEGGGKALLFENNGTEFPVLINSFGSNQNMLQALNVTDYDEIGVQLEELFKELAGPKKNILEKLKMLPLLGQVASWMPKVKQGQGVCQEVIHTDPDLGILPILKCWPHDGGKFITFPMVITKDPLSGIRNVGMYRMQVLSKNETGMHWHRHKVGARHYQEYKKLGQKMPIAVAIGGDPVYTYSATAPLPDNIDEYMLAGFLRKKKVELVKCITQDIEVPADADIIIEGYVDTSEDFIWEGPFGDHTGFYSLADWYPKFHVTCITHKKNAIYPTTVVGVPPQEDAYIGKATERIFLAPIKITMLPELTDMDLPFVGVAHNLTIVKIKKDFPGHALKIINALWGAGQMMFNKMLIVVDDSVDIHNYAMVAKAVGENVDAENDIHFSKGPLDVLDHASNKLAFGSKMGIDATVKYEEELAIENVSIPLEKITEAQLIESIPEIHAANVKWYNQGVPVLLVAANISDKKHFNKFTEIIAGLDLLKGLKFVMVTDAEVDVNNVGVATWIFANNIDPKRDSITVEATKDSVAKLVIDGTRKHRKNVGFVRDWPNIVTMDSETIKMVDERWVKYGLGELIKSPSIAFKKYVSDTGAVFKHGNE